MKQTCWMLHKNESAKIRNTTIKSSEWSQKARVHLQSCKLLDDNQTIVNKIGEKDKCVDAQRRFCQIRIKGWHFDLMHDTDNFYWCEKMHLLWFCKGDERIRV